MATKAELEAELASLKSRLEERDRADAVAAVELDDPEDGMGSETAARIRETLKEHGIDTDDLGDIGEKLTQSLTDLQKNQPLIALALAFALGFVAGRASK